MGRSWNQKVGLLRNWLNFSIKS